MIGLVKHPLLICTIKMMQYAEDTSRCSFHPREVVIGICAPCLTERLHILAAAAKKGHPELHRDASKKVFPMKASSSLHKVLAFASLPRRGKSDHVTDSATSSSLEDSFISIKFEKNGQASSDDRATNPKFSWEVNFNSSGQLPNKNYAVVEQRQPASSLRWRKKIDHLFHLVRWRRSTKGSNTNLAAGKSATVKSNRSWFRSFSTKRSALN